MGEFQTIGDGSSLTFEVAPGTYDLRAQSCDEEYVEIFEVDVSGDYVWDVDLLGK